MVTVTRERDLYGKHNINHYLTAGERVRINGEDYTIDENGYIQVDGEDREVKPWGRSPTLCRVITEEMPGGVSTYTTTEGEIEIEELVQYYEVDLFEERRQYVLDFLKDVSMYARDSDHHTDTLRDYMVEGKLPEVGKWHDETERYVVGTKLPYHEKMFKNTIGSCQWDDLEEGDKLAVYSRERMQEKADREHYHRPPGTLYTVGSIDSEHITLINPATDTIVKKISPTFAEKQYLVRRVKTGEYFVPNDYFRTCFLGLLLGNGWLLKSEEEIIAGYRELAKKKNPYKKYKYQDGSKGQWNTAMSHKLRGIRWLLGVDELDEHERQLALWGEPPEDEEMNTGAGAA